MSKMKCLILIIIILMSSCSTKKPYSLIKTESPMYTEGYFSWYYLNQEEILKINDVIFEGEYIESEYYTLKFDHVDYFDGVPDVVPMEHHYTILKFKLTKDYTGGTDGDVIHVAQRNYLNIDGENLNIMEFEKNKNYLIFAEDINKYAGDEIPINDKTFPAPFITVSNQFVFYTDDQIVRISDYLIAYEEIPDIYIGDLSIYDEIQRFDVDKTYVIPMILDLYEHYKM